MKLRLNNFRCYEKAEFDFGENGLTLISGSSGKGKSTLMLAIEFALFGTGTKLQTHGKRGCSVELEINSEFKIFRQKAPNRLVVNDIYEDDAGESIIREKFGSNMLTSYIPQNIRKTFILMSPAERLEFLESIISTGTDIQDVKGATKALIKKLGDEHNETIGALKVAENTLATIEEPVKPSFCSKHSLDEQRMLLAKISKRLLDHENTFKNLTKNVENSKKEREATTLLESIIAEKSSQLSDLQAQFDTEETEIDGFAGDDNLVKLKETLRSATLFLDLQAQHATNTNTIEEMRQSERQSIEQQITELKSGLWGEFSKDEATEQEALWKEEVRRKEKKRDLEQSRIDLSKRVMVNIEEEKQRSITLSESVEQLKRDVELAEYPLHSCPHCRSSLRFTGKSLVLSSFDVEKPDIGSMKALLKKQKTELTALLEKINNHSSVVKNLEELNTAIESIGDIDETSDESLVEITEYISKNKKDEDEVLKLEKAMNTPSKTIQLLMKKNDEISSKMNKEHYVENIEDVKKDISDQEKLKTIYDSIFLKRKKLTEQITKIKKDSLSLQEKHQLTWKVVRPIDAIESDISACLTDIKKLQKDNADDEKKRDCYKASIEYKKQYDTWRTLLTQKETLVYKEDDIRKRYAAACTFREKILEAESIAVTNMINTINTHAQFYLDHFFPEEPISIQLVAFKETKDVSKPQINLAIDYKGIEHDLTMLSGGELSRVILAFTLALAEIHDTPFVMLDESTSSLDQDLTGTVVDGLKENFGNKLVLIIAHQVVQGVFDKVVSLK